MITECAALPLFGADLLPGFSLLLPLVWHRIPPGLYYFLQFFRMPVCCAVYYFLLSAAWESLRALLLLSGLKAAANSLSLSIT